MNERISSGVRRRATGKKSMLLVASAALAVVLASCAAQRGGTGPTKPISSSQNGKVAFVRLDNRVGEVEIFVVEPDGGSSRKLVTEPAHDNFPAWSPDGRTVAFGRLRGRWGAVEAHRPSRRLLG